MILKAIQNNLSLVSSPNKQKPNQEFQIIKFDFKYKNNHKNILSLNNNTNKNKFFKLMNKIIYKVQLLTQNRKYCNLFMMNRNTLITKNQMKIQYQLFILVL